MANTYTLIASNTLSSAAATVTFDNIPNTFDDLILHISSRNDDAGTANAVLNLRLNNLSTSIYSFTALYGNGSAASSARASSTTSITDIYQSGDLATASTFGTVEIYIPKYLSTTKKPVGAYGAAETNNSAATMAANAGLVDLTSAVTRVDLLNNSTKQFKSGSSFWLYGIKNT